MAILAAVSYANDTSQCLSNAFGENIWSNVTKRTVQVAGFTKMYDDVTAYIAVSHSNKQIVYSFRGTTNALQLIQQLEIIVTPAVEFPAGGRVQKYWYDGIEAVNLALLDDLTTLIDNNPNYEILVTGHSLGAALASEAAALLSYNSPQIRDRIILYTFGQPRVGYLDYADAHNKLVNNSYRVVHYNDIVVHLPPCDTDFFKTECNTDGPYHHGIEVFYDAIDMPRDADFKVCLGPPPNEDAQCSDSNSIVFSCVYDMPQCASSHNHYFNINLSKFEVDLNCKIPQ